MPRSTTKPIIAMLVLAALCVAGCQKPAPQPPAIARPAAASLPTDVARYVSPEEAVKIIASRPAGLVVLDVRPANEYAQGHVAGAMHLIFDMDDTSLIKTTAGMDRNKTYLLYCAAGFRADKMANRLAELGFRDMIVVTNGGFMELAARKAPVEK